jgi:hypothetical protein
VSLWTRFFGRKSEPTPDERGDGWQWQVGDLAVCIGNDWNPGCAVDLAWVPEVGEVLRVAGIEDSFGTYINARIIVLFFRDKPCGWDHRGFRKALEDAEPAEAEFTALIKRPIRKRVKA